jgi:hypothetical protein
VAFVAFVPFVVDSWSPAPDPTEKVSLRGSDRVVEVPMRRILLCAAILGVVAPLAADPLPARSDRIVAYGINVRLHADTHQLEGREHLAWRNPSTDTVSDLWFHLYLNAFKNTKSTFMRESGGQLRGDRVTEGRWGWIDVTSLRIAGGPDLTGNMRFEHPDDDNADDQTVMRVTLPQGVPPGGTIALDIVFRAQLPQVFARSGYYRDFHLAGQWFPKLAVYEPAGMRGRPAGGWNCHQYHANSEFYADYGTYHVDITAPSDFVVGATGARTARKANADGTVTYTYEQADVHDFAWTADRDFLEVRRTFSAASDVTPAEYVETAKLVGRTLDDVRLSDVEIVLLIQRSHASQVERHIRAVKAGLKYYGLWYGRYPYRTITVVDPAPGGGGAGGMEYPTFITAGTSFLLDRWPFKGVLLPEMVTVHEFGHQFWYAMVGNNEFEEAWLDEGINSYSTGRVMEREYGSLVTMPGVKMGERDFIRLQNTPESKYDVILKPAWQYNGDYSFYSYTKPEIVLRTLENLLGRPTMARIMRTYQERWRFRHPSSADFVAVANEVARRDLAWFFDQTIRGTGVLDYEVASLTSNHVAGGRGLFDRDGKRVEAGQETGTGKTPTYRSSVVVRRRGDVRMPVEIAFKFEGRPPERVGWDGQATWKRFDFTRPERLEWADVDPDRKLELDVNWLNNGMRVESDRRPVASLTTRFAFVVQHLLALIGM